MRNVRMSELKYYETTVSAQSAYHNVGNSATAVPAPVIFNPWAQITQGTGQYGRIGDEIIPCGSKWRIHFQTTNSTTVSVQNLMFRVMLVVLPKTIAGTATSASTSPFDSQYNNSITAMVDPDTVKVLYDRTYSIQPGFAAFNPTNNTFSAAICSKFCKFFVKSGKGKLMYEQASNYLINRPMALYVLPYAYDGLVTTQLLGNVDVDYRLYFRDP